MAINKNFVVKNGLEVASDLIVANGETGKVGIGSTGPLTTLDVRGGIACTDIRSSGVGTFQRLEVTAGFSTNIEGTNINYSGLGTITTLTGTTVDYGTGLFDLNNSVLGIITSVRGTHLNYTGVSSITSARITSLNVSGFSTFSSYAAFNGGVNIDNLNVSGVGTIASISVDGSTTDNLVVNNFTNLSGVTTINGVTNIPNLTATNANVSGVSTLTTVDIGSGTFDDIRAVKVTVSGFTTAGALSATDVNASGMTSITDANVTRLTVTGVSTVGVLTGATSVSAGVYYGSAAGLTNVPAATPLGPDGSIQFNNSSTLDGSANLLWNDYNIIVAGGASFSGVVTATSFVGDGSGLIGVASTDNIQTATPAKFLNNVAITGITTVGTALTITDSLLDGGVSLRILGQNLKVSGVATAQDFDALSDVNFKENVNTVDAALAKVNQLRGVSFNWKESGDPSYGVIAQELETILPELVHGDDPKRVNYNGIIGVLIEAIKELSEKVERLSE